MPNLRTFTTTYRSFDEPEWGPLAAVSHLARSTPDLPAFHPGEFMWMCSVENKRKHLVVHLYKHYDTRHYLNLDLAGHAYEFRPDPDDEDRLSRGTDFSGRYRLFRSLDVALRRVGLWQFEYGALSRSFPPSQWPADPDDLALGGYTAGGRYAWVTAHSIDAGPDSEVPDDPGA